MAKIGFIREKGAKDSLAEQEETIQSIEHTIQNEIVNLGEFQRNIRIELKALEHLQHNFRLIEQFVESIEKLHNKRNQAFTSMRFLFAKRHSEMDINRIKAQYEIIRRLDQEIEPMLRKAEEELHRLLVEESHIIYSSDRQTQNLMHIIDDESRKLQVAVTTLRHQVESTYVELNNMVSTISNIERERISDLQKPRKIGF